MLEYSDEISACKYALRTFCVNNGVSNKGLKQSDAVAFYCNKKGLTIPKKSEELSFLLEIYFSNKCNYIKQGRLLKRKNSHIKLHHSKSILPPKDFYSSEKWIKLRTEVLRTYGKRCMKCGESKVEIHVDHIKPRSLFPKLELCFDNLQVLCRKCNLDKSNFHSTDYRNKKPQ